MVEETKGISWPVQPVREFVRVNRFDLAVGGTVFILVAAIGWLVLRGYHLPPRIVYLAPLDDPVENLFVIDPGSSNTVRQLTFSKGGVGNFDVSPDGSTLVYAELQDNGTANLYSLDLASGRSQMLYECKDAVCGNPAMRPDGKAVAFEKLELNTGTGLAPGINRIWILDLTTGAVQPLFKNNQQLGEAPRWTRDGTRLAVYDNNSDQIVIHDFTMDKDLTIPAFHGELAEFGQFSPDGRWLYFPKAVELPDHNAVQHLVLIDLSSQPFAQHDLEADSDGSDDVEASWQADSKHLIVARRPAGSPGAASAHLYTVDIATGIATLLYDANDYDQGNLSISPSNDSVLFQRFENAQEGPRTDLWIYDLKTGLLKQVASDTGSARWIP